MRFSCDGCDAKYMISDDKVGPGGVKVRCKKCGHVTHVRRGEPAEIAPEPGTALRGEWWVAIDDHPVGPVGIEVVQHHWDLGEIGPESLVWYSGLAEWSPISSVPELHGHLGGGMPVAPPLPPPPPPEPAPSSAPVPDDEWRPGAASALAALDEPAPRAGSVTDAIAAAVARDAPEPPPAAPAETTGAGTDPTGVVPLPMAGLERTTERRIATTPGPRGPRTPHRVPEPERGGRSLTVVLLVSLAVVAAVAAGLWWLTR